MKLDVHSSQIKSLLVLILNVFLIITISSPHTYAQSLYELDRKTDRVLLGSGIGIMSLGLYCNSTTIPLTQAEIDDLSKENVNRFDRSAIENWSLRADKASDVLLGTFGVLPATLFIAEEIRDDFCIVSTLFMETYLLTVSLNSLTKGLIQRTRPFVYNPDVSLKYKTKADARRSFYSGHTTLAFASAVFTAKIYSDYFPNFKFNTTVWCASLLGASAVAFLRYEAGKHYPTDVLVGALVGSVIGYAVPAMHKKAKNGNPSEPSEKQFLIALNVRF